jgi:hypothetical protein
MLYIQLTRLTYDGPEKIVPIVSTTETNGIQWESEVMILTEELCGTRSRYSDWLDDRGFGVRVIVKEGFFSSPRPRNRYWGPPSLLSNGHQGLFHRG